MTSVCAECIRETYVHRQIKKSGEVGRCDFCENDTHPVIELEELSEQVHSVLENHFYMTSPDPEGVDYLAAKYGEWEQPGEPVVYVIMNLIESSEEVAEALRESLSEKYDPHGKDLLIESCPYASESQYEERPIDTYEFQESWTSFRHEILSRSRFFNQKAKSALDHLFQGVVELETYTGASVVRVLSPAESIVRARMAKSYEELEVILKNAPRSLGAPPGRCADAGRMNAEGISVFYGATDIDTCIAEIRAPVGSYVVSGKFSPLRELRILDLTQLQSVFLQGSFFDAMHSESLSRVHFLKRLEAELSQPVMPGSESREYLPTQVVAEYLASHPEMNLDGVMFASLQSASDQVDESEVIRKRGKNIVLFVHACGLARYELPDGTEIDVSRMMDDPDDSDYSIWVEEKVPARQEHEEQSSTNDRVVDFLNLTHLNEVPEVELIPSIRLDIESIGVCRVEGVTYSMCPFNVSRHRSGPDDSGL